MKMEITEVDMDGYDSQGCLHEMFRRQARETPETYAFYRGRNFKGIDYFSDCLAVHLGQCGVGVNTVVGILMDRSDNYIMSVLGILKAGGAYVPLEVSYPQHILDSVLEDARSIAVCTTTTFLDRFHKMEKICVINIDELPSDCHIYISWDDYWNKTAPAAVPVSLDDMAYIVYSSGTAGKPKAIRFTHRDALFSHTWRHRAYPYKQFSDRVAVLSAWDMLGPLIKGIQIYLITDDVIHEPINLVDCLQNYAITRVLFTPSLLQAVLDLQGMDLKEKLKSVRQIWLHGEVVTTKLRDRLCHLLPWIKVLNLYRISECLDVAIADISLSMATGEAGNFCPVGKLLPQVHAVIMDEHQNVKAIGEPGEIYIGSPTLDSNQPDLNATRLIERPAHVSACVGQRLYRTGDWGFMLSDRTLHIHGRCDTTVRIRGYSVQLQAIERILLNLLMVSSCCVQAYGEEGTDKYLVAYVVQEPSTKLNVGEVGQAQNKLRNLLKERLPLYMIPTKIILLDKFPIHKTSGKLDKEKLAESEKGVEPGSLHLDDQSMSPTEKLIASVWCNCLNLMTVDVSENFFDLGGHSLAATRVMSEINEKLNKHLDTSSIFLYPTVQSLAKFVLGIGGSENIKLVEELDSIHISYPSDLDSKLRAFWESLKLNKNKCNFGNILITGGTGFLGSHLIIELLNKTQCLIYCIVGKSPTCTAMERVIEAQKRFGLPKVDEKLMKRIIAIDGDVSLLNLGLSDDAYNSLAPEIDFIIHASAKVNLIFPFHSLYKDNVKATKNIIQFALHTKVKPIHYISSNAVFANGQSGYDQTKWLAEQLVLRSAQSGLPCVVYRLGSTKRASCNPSDFTLYMIQGVIRTETVPDIKWKIEMTPIDFVQEMFVELFLDLNNSIGKIYHFVNEDQLPCEELWKLMERRGYHLKSLPYNDWAKLVHANEDLKPLSHLLQSLVKNENYFTNLAVIRKETLNCSIEKRKVTYPVADAELYNKYLDHLLQLGCIPVAANSPSESGASAEIDTDLSGKIVLVSEASSDIGAAIAEKLALCNAKVAMFDTNLDKLNNLKEKFEQAGATQVFAMKVDVTSIIEVKNAVGIIERLWGPVEILVDNGNCMYYQVMKNCDVAKWCKMQDGKGSLNCLAAVFGGMAERKNGRIVNITSDAGKVVMEKFDFSSSVESLNPSDVANAVVSALKQPFSRSKLK
ncbi:linear gramicidin synthase subunit D-like [Nilaparvata lugens]|uniref:linear gramicidin synthase subunit D-like n=1 Tax=Nilaparvata lugens TaxID=108931 RepID=UPI00193D5B42|nr:linear gramicidin synthase subunit D-like [Nilaparvata lugens]